MLQEFRDFVNRGNFVDIAVAFVVGAAFATVVSAFTDRIVAPAIAFVVGSPNFDNFLTFGENGSVGAFITAAINFLIVAFVMFLVVRSYNTFKVRYAVEPEAEEEVSEPVDVTLLREIRDALVKDVGRPV